MKERTRQHLMRVYNGCSPMFLCQANRPDRLLGAMVADLVEIGGSPYRTAPLEVYEQADRTARQFMLERGHHRLT